MKNTQKGRSMVEMLGVLAIIGVLSVGGIAGYTVAMNRYRANQILDMASKVAVVAQTMNAGAGGCATAGVGTAPATGACAAADTQATGMQWTATGGVTGFYANGTAANGTVLVTLNGTVAAGVQTAIDSIVGGGAYQYDKTNGTITITTN